MRRFFAIGSLVLFSALLLPAALLACTSTEDDAQSVSVEASESDSAAVTTDSMAEATESTTDSTMDSTGATEDTDSKPWVGLHVMDVTERLAQRLEIDAEDGVAVIRVVEDGPADDAGIEAGDVIVSVAGSDVSTVSEVRGAIGDASVRDTLAFTVERDGGKSTFNVTLGERPEPQSREGRSRSEGAQFGAMGSAGIGATIATLNADLAENLEIEAEEGIVIVRVVADSPADDAGLQSGDVIVSVDGNSVDLISDVVDVVRDAEVGDTIAFVVDRNGESANLTLTATVEEGYGLRGTGLNLRGLGGIRGVLSGDEDGPVSITVSAVTIKEVGDGSVTLTPAEDGNDDITAAVTDGSFIFKDGEKANLSDLVADDEGFAAVIDGELSVLIIGSLDDIGRGHGRFGGGDSDGGGAGAFRRGGRGGNGGALTLPPGFSGDRDFLGPLGSLGDTLEQPQAETIT